MWRFIPWVGRRRQRDVRELVLLRAAIEQRNVGPAELYDRFLSWSR